MSTHRIKKVLVVTKSSAYQEHVVGRKNHDIAFRYRQGHAAASKIFKAHRTHRRTLSVVIRALKDSGLRYVLESREKKTPIGGYDLIVTVGGDGTFLRTSHRIAHQLVMGVNSAPGFSVGALCTATAADFKKKLSAVLSGRHKVGLINRLQIVINGKRHPSPALNDVLFANNCPAGTSRYVIRMGKKEEEHRSSGVWVATAAGSTAAISASGGKVLPHFSRKIQFLVREPYGGRRTSYRLVKKVLNPNSSLQFISKMVDASLFVDGAQTIIPVRFGDSIRIQSSKKPLRVVRTFFA